MVEFVKPECDIVRFASDVITSSNCGCWWPDMQMSIGDEICTGGTGVGGDIECIITDEQGNC